MGRLCFLRENSISYIISYIFEMSTQAFVVSHSIINGQPFGAFPNEIVKFSTGDGRVETFISTRSRSESAPG